MSDILDGCDASVPAARVKAARFDERLALVGILTDALQHRVHDAIELEQALFLTRADLVAAKDTLTSCDFSEGSRLLLEAARAAKEAPDVGESSQAASLVGDAAVIKAEHVRCLEALASAVATGAAGPAEAGSEGAADAGAGAAATPFDAAKAAYNARVKEQRALASTGVGSLDNAFSFLDGALGESSQESLVLTTKLSLDPLTVKFVGQYGSEQYMKHIQSLDGLDELGVK